MLTSPKENYLAWNCAQGKRQDAGSAEDLLQCMHEHQELKEQPIDIKKFRWINDNSCEWFPFSTIKQYSQTIQSRFYNIVL